MAFRCFLKAKIHGATVTFSDLNYEGSLSICPKLMKAADILPNERVDVYNITNGSRFTTYAIEGKEGEIGLNGAAARKGAVGDKIIIVTYTWLENKEIDSHTSKVVLVDDQNKIVKVLEK